jgi:hypothetical protein
MRYYYILLNEEDGCNETIATLNAGVTPADVIEWYRCWKPNNMRETFYGPKWSLWGEEFEYTECRPPQHNRLSHDRKNWLLGEWGRFTDSEGVTHFLWRQPKLMLEYYAQPEDAPVTFTTLRYGGAFFSLKYPYSISDKYEAYINKEEFSTSQQETLYKLEKAADAARQSAREAQEALKALEADIEADGAISWCEVWIAQERVARKLDRVADRKLRELVEAIPTRNLSLLEENWNNKQEEEWRLFKTAKALDETGAPSFKVGEAFIAACKADRDRVKAHQEYLAALPDND